MLTVDDVRAKLHVSKYTVYRLIHSGQLPALKVSTGRNQFLIQEQALDDYLAGATYNGLAAYPVATDNQPELLTVSEVAQLLRCSRDTVRRLVAAGELTAVRNPGRNSRLRIHRSSVRQYLGQAAADAATPA
jgi:excisionase family DNA binding protein